MSALCAVCAHHVSILERAAQLRVLESEEIEFIVSFDLYKSGMMESSDFRDAANRYFQK